jgi:hypothetical protein
VVSLGIVVLSPIWVVRLVAQGRYLFAAFLASWVIAGVTSFVWLLTTRHRLTAWCAMAAVFAVVFLLRN